MVRMLLVAALAVAGAACSKASNEAETKQWPDKPPPKDMPPPADLAIGVLVDGTPSTTITAQMLNTTKPDFADAERTAWLIATLVPEARPPGTIIEAVSPAGMSLKQQRPLPTGLEPVLFLTRRGEIIVSTIDPKDPFPRFHGQGGRLHRAGDSFPQVRPVARLEITTAKK
ncbi:MAG: hypothetical protein JNL83_27345 [Myxococcales bacterium]|nr:hypothetical protein [Myxococcales bacterium]